ncbi:MAG TPA: hypothetical protein VKU90_09725 [Caulobacteraceae bacterium]|nr:hypothetical protein [Caulobacteraceae bacterium]
MSLSPDRKAGLGAAALASLVLQIAPAAALAASAAPADAASICQGAQPRPGAAVHGPVLHVESGSRLCIATGASPSTWVPIDLKRRDLTQAALMTASFGKTATCVIGPDGAGDCTIEGRPLAQALRRSGPVLAACPAAGPAAAPLLRLATSQP